MRGWARVTADTGRIFYIRVDALAGMCSDGDKTRLYGPTGAGKLSVDESPENIFDQADRLINTLQQEEPPP